MRCVLLSSAIGSALATSLIDPVPLTEYYSRTLKDYKPLTWDGITPTNAQKLLRVRNVADKEFNDLVRRGYPFVVEDCIPSNELSNMPCSEYGKRFPQEHMKAEYTPGQAHVYLGDSDWHSVKKPTAKAKKHLSLGKPLSGPYVWHVKDETVDKKTKPTLAKMFPVPYFLNHSTVNREESLDSFEFWFGLEEGGTQAHADAYCETTLSMQLRGKKVWRLGAFPNITNAFQPHSFHDAQIYKTDWLWQPEYEEAVGAGECMVFPMGYIHETYIYPGDGGEDVCSVASTYQIQDPQAVFQWKNFLTRWGLSHYAREEPCIDRMEPYVHLGHRGPKGKDEKQIREGAKQVFAAADTDGNGRVTRKELEANQGPQHFPWTNIRGDKKAVLAKASKEKVAWMVEDTVLYHDSNGDGEVSLEEFEDSVLKFWAIKQRIKSIKKAKSRTALLEKERKWVREHLCTSDDCVLLRQLEHDFKNKGKVRHEEL
jgi:hypothetical protein